MTLGIASDLLAAGEAATRRKAAAREQALREIAEARAASLARREADALAMLRAAQAQSQAPDVIMTARTDSGGPSIPTILLGLGVAGVVAVYIARRRKKRNRASQYNLASTKDYRIILCKRHTCSLQCRTVHCIFGIL